jgi:glutaredoxin
MAARPKVTLYTRAGCCLCDEAKHVLESARRRAGFELEELDIDADPVLLRLYNHEVPVIAINGSKAFKYKVTEAELLKKLEARA